MMDASSLHSNSSSSDDDSCEELNTNHTGRKGKLTSAAHNAGATNATKKKRTSLVDLVRAATRKARLNHQQQHHRGGTKGTFITTSASTLTTVPPPNANETFGDIRDVERAYRHLSKRLASPDHDQTDDAPADADATHAEDNSSAMDTASATSSPSPSMPADYGLLKEPAEPAVGEKQPPKKQRQPSRGDAGRQKYTSLSLLATTEERLLLTITEPTLMAFYSRFLESIHCEEQLHFWRAAVDCRVHSRLEDVRRVVQQFFQDNAPEPVNVDAQTRAKVLQTLADSADGAPVLQSIFDSTLTEIWTHWLLDLFPRFERSSFYEQYREERSKRKKAKLRQLLGQQLKSSELVGQLKK